MWNCRPLHVLLCLLILARSENIDLCGPRFEYKCFCGEQEYGSEHVFIVNCTNTGFSNPDILKHLPKQAEVIVFNGNNFSSLPWNVFGEKKENVPPNLHTIDLSNNSITDIAGKSFHHVSEVKKLILNHNKMRWEHVHSRMFSNFFNLCELQLINAFDKNLDKDFPSALHEIFFRSNLSKLTSLHLDNNHLENFEDQTFCDIPQLEELYLAGNNLSDISFNVSCLLRLRYLSLKSNNIKNLSHKTLRILDSIPARGQPLKVDLQFNPWICKSGADADITSWLRITKVDLVGDYSCSAIVAQMLIFTTVFVFCVIGAGVFFFKGTQIRNKFNPLLNTVSHKMQYTTLRRREEPEVDV